MGQAPSLPSPTFRQRAQQASAEKTAIVNARTNVMITQRYDYSSDHLHYSFSSRSKKCTLIISQISFQLFSHKKLIMNISLDDPRVVNREGITAHYDAKKSTLSIQIDTKKFGPEVVPYIEKNTPALYFSGTLDLCLDSIILPPFIASNINDRYVSGVPAS
eukprot:TRINITY_DN786_c0_g1_i1.p1 TRINITY_DN786_c0_g1~~TRINITY_DN786_c0_g1_i1.p1  ORF type:complete len:161 (+),score=34.12 TRINITY_DN786_c0_g1_i1:46-528(+)